MFWKNFIEQCNEKGVAPNAAAQAVGIKSSATVTGWKNGAMPRDRVLLKLSAYFGCSIDELKNGKKEPATNGDGLVSGESYAKWADKDIRLLMWFRSLPDEKQRAILISQDAPEELL